MKKYIKINSDREIIDVFFEYQIEKFDGTELFLEDTNIIKHKLRTKESDPWKSISDDYGFPLFRKVEFGMGFVDNDVSERFLNKYKIKKLKELKEAIKENLFEVTRTLDQIRTQYGNLKSASSGWTTITEVDTAYNNAITWLGIS